MVLPVVSGVRMASEVAPKVDLKEGEQLDSVSVLGFCYDLIDRPGLSV